MPDVPAQPEPTRQSVLARYPLLCFFVMAYAFTWIVISPWTLGATGAGLLPIDLAAPATGLVLAAGILAGPTLAAIIMTAATEGRTGVHRLLGRLVLWRVGVRWYLLALLGVPLIMLLGFLAYAMAPPDLDALGGPAYALTYLLGFVLTMVLGGPLFEEIGWRGFALPRLQRRYGPWPRLSSSVSCGRSGTCPSSSSRRGPRPPAAVVVVGAGPTGLMLAGDLPRPCPGHGTGTTCPRVERHQAFAVHARTMEELQVRGVAAELATSGTTIRTYEPAHPTGVPSVATRRSTPSARTGCSSAASSTNTCRSQEAIGFSSPPGLVA